MKVRIDYSDGVYTLQSVLATEAVETGEVAEIPDAVWAVYQRFCGERLLWHEYIRRLDTEAYERANKE